MSASVEHDPRVANSARWHETNDFSVELAEESNQDMREWNEKTLTLSHWSMLRLALNLKWTYAVPLRSVSPLPKTKTFRATRLSVSWLIACNLLSWGRNELRDRKRTCFGEHQVICHPATKWRRRRQKIKVTDFRFLPFKRCWAIKRLFSWNEIDLMGIFSIYDCERRWVWIPM